jgi:PPOX class probable F420-dependent enzyme
MPKLTEEQADLLREPFIGFVATVMADGSPQVTPVWIDTDGENVLFNMARGRVKEANLRRDPRVAVAIVDPKIPDERALVVRGVVTDITPEGGKEHIDKMAKKYRDFDEYPWLEPGEERLIVKIRPQRIIDPT